MMTEKVKLQTSDIEYSHISELGFVYQAGTIGPLNTGDVKPHIELVKGLNVPEHAVRIVCTVYLDTERVEGEKESKLEYKTDHLFNIVRLSDFVEMITGEDNESQYEVDPELDITLSTVVYSTVRGMLYGKTQGTHFAKFILPIAKPIDLI